MTDDRYHAFARPSAESDRLDGDIEVSGCIVCMTPTVEVVMPHRHVEGRRVAVPARVGLCSPCVGLLKAHQFAALARRADPETWSDFGESDFIDTARDLAYDLAPYSPRE